MRAQRNKRAPLIEIQRRAYNSIDFDEEFASRHVDLSVYGSAKRHVKQITANPWKYTKGSLIARLPLIQWLFEYNIRENLASDLISGVTVGVFNIPQGMAYGLLCGLPAVFGLYTSFYPPIFYALFGTSRHIAIGTFSVISLMTSNVINRLAIGPCQQTINETAPAVTDWFCAAHEASCPIDSDKAIYVALALTFLVGVFQVLFGILNMGFLSVYLSDQLVEGLTTGSAVLVLTSQVPSMFGNHNLPKTGRPFDVLRFYGCFASKIAQTNWMAIVISTSAIVILVIFKRYIAPLWKRYLKMPLPVEIILVIVTTVISYETNLPDVYGIAVVGHIPCGLYPPAMPSWSIMESLIADAAAIAVVSYTICVSLAKLFAKKYKYRIVANQEWFAYGTVSILSSFFGCHPICASLSRSVVQESQGGKSQVAGFVGGLVVMIFLLFLAPYLEYLPKCILASVIVVALKGIFAQLANLPKLWKSSKSDFLIWIVSFLSVILFDISIGLIISIIFGLLTIVFKSQWPDSICLGQIEGTELYRGLNAYNEAKEVEGIKIYRFDFPLFFANVELFKDGLRCCTGIDPIEQWKEAEKIKECSKESDCALNSSVLQTESGTTKNESDVLDHDRLHTIVIDCSSFPYVDIMGIEAMKSVYLEYAAIGIDVLFASCKVSVRQLLKRTQAYDVIPKSCFHPSVHDSVSYATMKACEKETICQHPQTELKLMSVKL